MVYLSTNGNLIGQIFIEGTYAAGSTLTVPGQLGSITGAQNVTPFLFEPGSDTVRTLTVQINDNCSNGAHYTVRALNFDVIRFS